MSMTTAQTSPLSNYVAELKALDKETFEFMHVDAHTLFLMRGDAARVGCRSLGEFLARCLLPWWVLKKRICLTWDVNMTPDDLELLLIVFVHQSFELDRLKARLAQASSNGG